MKSVSAVILFLTDLMFNRQKVVFLALFLEERSMYFSDVKTDTREMLVDSWRSFLL